jgi:flagellar biosynthetic protein FlhB
MGKPKRYKMNLQLFGGDKTEKATPKKRQEARKKGQVAKSSEISGAVVLFSALLSLRMFGGFMKERFINLFTDVLQNRLMMDVTPQNVAGLFNQYGLQILILLAPLMLVTFILALAVNFAQVGFMASGEGLTPKFSKINPLKGLKNIFSMRSVVEFLKSVFKLVLIAYLVYSTLWGKKREFCVTLACQFGRRLPVHCRFDHEPRHQNCSGSFYNGHSGLYLSEIRA